MQSGEPPSPGPVSPVTATKSSWWTLANGLTLVRLLLVPALAIAITEHRSALALLIFVTAIVSDLADGRVARMRGEATAFGGFFDHVTDALFVATGLLALSQQGVVPWLLPLLLLIAFAQYSLDSRVLAGRPLRASSLGRWNGIAYYVALGIPVIRDGLGVSLPGDDWVHLLGMVLVVSTLISMADRAVALVRR